MGGVLRSAEAVTVRPDRYERDSEALVPSHDSMASFVPSGLPGCGCCLHGSRLPTAKMKIGKRSAASQASKRGQVIHRAAQNKGLR
jgi:hypothetical protein